MRGRGGVFKLITYYTCSTTKRQGRAPRRRKTLCPKPYRSVEIHEWSRAGLDAGAASPWGACAGWAIHMCTRTTPAGGAETVPGVQDRRTHPASNIHAPRYYHYTCTGAVMMAHSRGFVHGRRPCEMITLVMYYQMLEPYSQHGGAPMCMPYLLVITTARIGADACGCMIGSYYVMYVDSSPSCTRKKLLHSPAYRCAMHGARGSSHLLISSGTAATPTPITLAAVHPASHNLNFMAGRGETNQRGVVR